VISGSLVDAAGFTWTILTLDFHGTSGCVQTGNLMLTRDDVGWLFSEMWHRYGRMEGANERDQWEAVLNGKGMTISQVQRALRRIDAADVACPCTPERFYNYA